MLDCSFHWCTGAGVRIKVLKMSEKCESINMIEVSVSDTGKSILLYIKWWPWKKVVGFILKIFAFIWNHLWSFWLDGLGFLLPEIFTAKFDKLSEKCEKLELCFDSLHLSNLFLLSIHGLVLFLTEPLKHHWYQQAYITNSYVDLLAKCEFHGWLLLLAVVDSLICYFMHLIV